MKVIALETQVNAEGISYLPNEVFEITDEETLQYKLRIGLVAEYQEAEEKEKKPKATKKVLVPEADTKVEETE
jgi:uncharacterized protein YjiK